MSDRVTRLLAVGGRKSVDAFHRDLGRVLWDRCGMTRSAAGLTAARERVGALREAFWRDVYVGGRGADFNQALATEFTGAA